MGVMLLLFFVHKENFNNPIALERYGAVNVRSRQKMEEGWAKKRDKD